MHLVIGAGEFLGDHVSRALSAEVPVIVLHADADEETLRDAMKGVEFVHMCARAWSPARRLKYRRQPPSMFARVVDAARHAGVRRLIHLSTADVYGPDHYTRINEKARLRPVHPYEKLRLVEEVWLRDSVDDLEVITLRPARIFGMHEDWLIPRLMTDLTRGRIWLPGGGRVSHTFIAASDVGRACLAAADRGTPGHVYLLGGFDSTWREFIEVACAAVDIRCDVGALPYDVAFVRALGQQMVTPPGAPLWPGVYAVDVIGKPHLYDDSRSRRDLTWSPAVGSFDQEMPAMLDWLERVVSAAPAARAPTA